MDRGDIKKSFNKGRRHQSRVDTPSLCLLALCLSEMYANSLRLKESACKTRPASTMLDDLAWLLVRMKERKGVSGMCSFQHPFTVVPQRVQGSRRW